MPVTTSSRFTAQIWQIREGYGGSLVASDIKKRWLRLALAGLFLWPVSASTAQERLCDPSFEDCRAPLIQLIRDENVGIDVAFWFMEDSRYANEIIARWRAKVPVRVLVDTEANAGSPVNADILKTLKDAGIPMREKTSGGILHWKLMLFAGQGIVEFSGANYSPNAFRPNQPYTDYVDEAIYFTDDSDVVGSFKTKYDDIWTSQTGYSNYANVTTLARSYETFAIHPDLNFPPGQDFANRSVKRYDAEAAQIDAIMYRITDRRHTDALIRARERGVPVRLITEPFQYRDPTRLWHSWNVDRLYMAGVQIRHRKHAGLNHEKLTMLYSQGMSIFGSSNWTGPSANSQLEHNYFTTKPWFFQWSRDHFDRKWTNGLGYEETEPFLPQAPDAPVNVAPADAAAGQPLTVTLKWYAGPWAHKYDVYLGTDPANLTRMVTDVELGPSEHAKDYVTWTATGLAESTTYYWKVVARTMANLERTGRTWSFRTQGSSPTAGAGDVVLWAHKAPVAVGWSAAGDSTAAGGARLANPNAGAAKVSAPLVNPAQYFEMGFAAEAGVAYRLWIRGKADKNSYSNDSVYVQFSDSITATGAPTWRIGTTSGTTVMIEDCSGCGLSNWGWQDNAYGTGALGTPVYFETAGPHTIRVQVREDGLSIDQIVLSREQFLTTPPGATKDDGTIYAEQGAAAVGGSDPPPTTVPLPDGWSSTDIGGVGVAGDVTYSNGMFSLDGSGADIWGSADEFRFAYRSLTGNGEILARVATLEYTHAWAKTGVMMREALTAGSRHATMFVSAANGLAFQRRVTTGGVSTNTSAGSGAAPYWVKLVRNGNTFSASFSADGTNWTLAGSESITMPDTIYVGLPITSHDDTTLATATIDSVAVNQLSTSPPPPPTLPAGWANADVGSVGLAGSATYSSGVFTVGASGADIWGAADQFHFAYQPLTGDGTITARVSGLTNTHSWAKAGVMLRDTLADGSAHATMFVSAGRGLAFQRRVLGGGTSTHTAGAAAGVPHWVRLSRSGMTFTAYTSADGVSWTLVGSDTIAMGPTIYAGLAVTSHDNTRLTSATITDVSITP